MGLLATCRRAELTYEVSLADVVFPTGSAGALLGARYRRWLGLPPAMPPGHEAARPHKVEVDDIVVGSVLELVVLACKSNALRCRLLGSAREVTLRTAVRDEIAGSIIAVTPKKQWTHARHPYLSGDVSSVRIDASVLGLVPLALTRAGRIVEPRRGHSRYKANVKTPTSAGPIATRIVRALRTAKGARVVDLRAFREGTARAAELQKSTDLRDLVSGARVPCIVPSGWRGARGEVWLARVLPPPVGAVEVSAVFTTPYVLRGAREQDWAAYLDRTLGAARGDASKTTAALKYSIDWSEYIFAGYAGHVTEAIFLEGLPDVPTSLPHYSPRTR